MQLKPAPTKPSSSLKDIAASAVQPNTLPPKISGAISIPELPSLRLCMSFPVQAATAALTEARAVCRQGGWGGRRAGALSHAQEANHSLGQSGWRWRCFFFGGVAGSPSADQPPPISGCTRASKPPPELLAGALEARGAASLRPCGLSRGTMRWVSGAICMISRVTPGVITENGLTMIWGALIEP